MGRTQARLGTGSHLTVGSLFTGIGGFDLGLERAGCRVLWQCEIDAWCRRVLQKHWSRVKRYGDIKTLKNPPQVNILCGGFPCQDLSELGRRKGIRGDSSGLWFEFARIIGEIRPDYVIVENVPALQRRGLGQVLGSLAEIGYDAEWDCIPAAAVGAHHQRDRIWIVAYPEDRSALALGKEVGYTHGVARLQAFGRARERQALARSEALGHAVRSSFGPGGFWEAEPELGRVADGVPHRVDRLGGLGNALVPQVAEWIGRGIVEAHANHC